MRKNLKNVLFTLCLMFCFLMPVFALGNNFSIYAEAQTVSTVEALKSEIASAPTDGTLKEIIVSDNIIFTSADTITISSGKNIKLTNTSTVDLKKSGGNIFNLFNIESGATLEIFGNESYYFNIIGASYTKPTTNESSYYGKDSLFNNVGTLILGGSVVCKDNLSYYGPVVYNKGNLTINGGQFYGNKAHTVGGVIYSLENSTTSINGGTFSNNYASSSGSVIFNNKGTINLKDAIFADNRTVYESSYHSSGFAGGAIANSSSKTVYIDNCQFTSNKNNEYTKTNSSGFGSAVCLYSGSAVITNSKFISNISTYGTVASTTTSSNITIENCEFLSNSASYGGALYANGTLDIIDSTFSANNCTNGGGAIVAFGTTTITNTIFSKNNNAGKYVIIDNNTPIVDVFGNQLNFAGALAVSGNTTIKDCTFTENKISGKPNVDQGKTNITAGGAIAVYGGRLTFVEGDTGTVISGNQAEYGAGIAVLSGGIIVENSTAINTNKYLTISNNVASKAGGGLYIAVEGNSSEGLYFDYGKIGDNTAEENENSNDVYYYVKSETELTYYTNFRFGAEITTTKIDENVKTRPSIYSENNFPLGTNFKIASGLYVTLARGKVAYVKNGLSGNDKILLNPIINADETLIGGNFATFSNKNIVRENVFILMNPDFQLIPPNNYTSFADDAEVKLTVKGQFTIKFFEHYDASKANEADRYVNQIGSDIKVDAYGNVTLPSAPTREGYVFVCWSCELSTNSTYNAHLNVLSNANIYGIWKKILTINFKTQNAQNEYLTTSTLNTKLEGDTLSASDFPDAPDKEGYVKEWRIGSATGEIYTNQVLTDDTDIYLYYKITEVKITFWVKNESGEWVQQQFFNGDDPIEYVITYNTKFSDSAFTLPTVPGTIGPNYWSYDKFGNKRFNVDALIRENTTLYLIEVGITFWVENESGEWIEQQYFDGEKSINLKLPYQSKFSESGLALPDIPEIVGYKKTYWAYDKLGDSKFDPNAEIKNNINLYQIYVIDTYDVTYILNYYNGTNLVNTKTYLYSQLNNGNEIRYGASLSFAPTAEGVAYTQQRNLIWKYNNEEVLNGGSSLTIVEPITIVGEVNINVYTATFYVDNNAFDTVENIPYGSKINLSDIKAIPEKEGHTQTSPYWEFDFDTQIKQNTTINAVYKKNVYTVTFNLPNGEIAKRTVEHGGTVKTDNIYTAGIGEVLKFDKSTKNIKEDLVINVTTVNVLMWALIAFGILMLIIIIIVIIKVTRKKRIKNITKKPGGPRNGPYITGD